MTVRWLELGLWCLARGGPFAHANHCLVLQSPTDECVFVNQHLVQPAGRQTMPSAIHPPPNSQQFFWVFSLLCIFSVTAVEIWSQKQVATCRKLNWSLPEASVVNGQGVIAKRCHFRVGESSICYTSICVGASVRTHFCCQGARGKNTGSLKKMSPLLLQNVLKQEICFWHRYNFLRFSESKVGIESGPQTVSLPAFKALWSISWALTPPLFGFNYI